ncbi:MAG TPA: sugar phosphate nucleotidyltransferase [Ignavibacteria bacterium]|nr:sugar phosphate nucleotidyltransferase [Ignavibacteria bacterium]
MKVIIPVAGFGTRLRPHTLLHPKVLMTVAGKPMIYFIVEQIIKEKISNHIVFVVGYLGDRIEKYILKEFVHNKDIKFEFLVQDEPKGLGHAVHCAKPAFTDDDKEAFIILGDTLFDVDLKKLVSNDLSVIGVKKVDDPRRFGVVETNNDKIITRLVEKPASKEVSPSNDAIVGLYYIKNSDNLFGALEYIFKNEIKTKDEYQLTDALAKMIADGKKMTTYDVQGWLDCGKIETILETNAYLLDKLYANKNYEFENTIIMAPVYIADGCKIKNCTIGPNVSISKDCIIENTIIKNSIVNDKCEIDNSEINDSLVGFNCKVKNYKGTMTLGDYSEV